MFDPLPPETLALKVLLADLHDDLEGRVERLRLLIAIESDFGGGRGLLLPGGMPAQLAYIETGQAFVAGNDRRPLSLRAYIADHVQRVSDRLRWGNYSAWCGAGREGSPAKWRAETKLPLSSAALNALSRLTKAFPICLDDVSERAGANTVHIWGQHCYDC